jgi:polyisoprenyl-teichoic acid--peptidoglycan teichoic acid transferase
LWRPAAAVAVVSLLAPACSSASGRPAVGAGTHPAPTVTVQAPEIDLVRVRGFPAKGEVRTRRIRPVAGDVRDTLAELYTSAFMDPGAAPAGVLAHFRGEAQREARRDLGELTLGRAASRISEVKPRRSPLRVDILTDQGRHAVAAVATIEFRALGRSEDGIDTPLRHRAEYLLRRFGGRWRIVSYRVERHLVPETIPGIPTKGSLFVLALGSDARKGQAVTRTRADSIHIIGVDLRERKASILGIPRDSYVPIPGHGSNKINAALFFGGPDMMVRTVEGLTGIRMDGYLLTGFGDFKHAVDRIGGITVRVPYPMNDPASGAHFRRGETHLNGTRALAFSRNRKDTPAGDFSRSLNQGTVMLAALRELKDDVARDPLALFRWIQAAAEHVWTDLSLDEMLGFLYAALSVDPSRVRNRVVSGSGGTVGGASVIHLGSGARAMFRDLRRDGLLGH